MPRVSEFYGIAIYMYFRDHGVPHFHAVYAGQEAVLSIRGLRVLEGRLPQRALALVRAWGRLHLDVTKNHAASRRSRRSKRSTTAGERPTSSVA